MKSLWRYHYVIKKQHTPRRLHLIQTGDSLHIKTQLCYSTYESTLSQGGSFLKNMVLPMAIEGRLVPESAGLLVLARRYCLMLKIVVRPICFFFVKENLAPGARPYTDNIICHTWLFINSFYQKTCHVPRCLKAPELLAAWYPVQDGRSVWSFQVMNAP